jgi:quercetin dioxygenase-like cupin family protein
MTFSLRLVEDRLAPDVAVAAAPAVIARVVYAAEGEATVDGAPVRAATAALASGAAAMRAAGAPARVLRFELVAQPPPAAGGRLLLEHPLALDPRASWLIRCDRVDFAPGGVALPHRHRGGGIRCLLRGRLTVTVGEGAPRSMGPGDAWFESGREPVLAVAGDEETSFVRVAVLPAEIRGASSIVYVDPADASRGRPRAYTVHVDEPIAVRRA